MNEEISIRRIIDTDPEIIARAFAAQNWNKPSTQYRKYLKEQTDGTREVLIAEAGGEFAGYLTIIWQSDFAPFGEREIPEIVDFNVLIKFQNRGIGAKLMDTAENLIAEKYKTAGIRVGLTADYGAAQRMYVRRGYIPDGFGVSQNGVLLKYGDKITVDDNLNLHFTKNLEIKK
jgi:ribosomal protein S18 acetylase RimI-like enzyme